MRCKLCDCIGVFRISVYVLNMNGPMFECSARRHRVPPRRNRVLLAKIAVRSGYVVGRRQTKKFAVEPPDECLLRPAQGGRRLDKCIEHALEIEGRAAD